MKKEKNDTYSDGAKYMKARTTILMYARSRIRRQAISAVLDERDLWLAEERVSDRCDWYWFNIPIGRGQKAYLNRIAHNVVYEILQKYREKVEVRCVPGADMTRLLIEHELSDYLSTHEVDDKGAAICVSGWIFPSQTKSLREDMRVEELLVVDFRAVRVLEDLSQVVCGAHGQASNMLRQDFTFAVYALAEERPREGKIAVGRWLHGFSRGEVADKLRLGVRRCDQLLKEFTVEFRNRFPEFRDYLGDFDRDFSGW
jgi:DNA-directed RNA polymerase specialized sigma24 family protein